MSPKSRRISLTVIRCLLGILFLLSGIGKLIDGSDARYLVELLATEFFWLIEYANPIVISTSLLELALAVFLLWGRHLRYALYGSLALVSTFTLVLAYFYLQGMSIASCGCFGALGIGGGLEATLLRNAVLLALIATALFIGRRNAEKQDEEDRPEEVATENR